MVQFRDNLFIGGYKDSSSTQLLIENGITAVLNVAYEIDDPAYPPLGIRHIKVGLMDNGENAEYMKYQAVLALEVMLQKGEKVLVHCAAGLSRSVYVACQAIANADQRHLGEVFDELRIVHPFAMLGPLFNGAPNPMKSFYESQEKEAKNT